MPESLFVASASNFIKNETLAQVLSCEFYEISKNIFFYRTPLVAASGISIDWANVAQMFNFENIHIISLAYIFATQNFKIYSLYRVNNLWESSLSCVFTLQKTAF